MLEVVSSHQGYCQGGRAEISVGLPAKKRETKEQNEPDCDKYGAVINDPRRWNESSKSIIPIGLHANQKRYETSKDGEHENSNQ